MNSSLDLNLLLFARQGGSEQAELPDLFAVTPPRRTARGREADNLILYLSMAGNSPLPAEEHAKLLEQLAHKFYKTPGSLTSALRTAADALNIHLLNRNLQSTSMGRQGIGQLILVALRADILYMAQCGAVCAFLVTPNESLQLYDLQSSGRGLGLSRTTAMRFVQVKMNPDDFLVLSTQSPPRWANITLTHPQQQGIEPLRRQLLETSGQDFNAVIIQAQAGTGKLNRLKRSTEIPSKPSPGAGYQPGEAATPAMTSADIPRQPDVDRKLGLPPSPATIPGAPGQTAGLGTVGQAWSTPAGQPTEDRKVGVPPSSPAEAMGSSEISPPIGESPQTVSFTTQATAQPAPGDAAEIPALEGIEFETVETLESFTPAKQGSERSRKTRDGSSTWRKFSTSVSKTLFPVGRTILQATRSAMGTLSGALLRLLKNLLPDADVLRLPPSMMIFIALAIPLVLATIGGLIFLQRGRAQQHEIYYQKAVEAANYAASLTNPVEQRLAWQTVLGDLDKAESYSVTSQSQSLRTSVTENIDKLDSTRRLDYKQAIVGGLDANVKVTRIIATATDLYLLNSTQGSVMRAIMTARGYEIDPTFQCGPTYGPINVGPLVDIAELPAGSFENASVLGMDKDGNLLYCVVGSQPYSASMAPPNTGFGEPSAMTLDRSDLFVLDQKVNAVWIYRDLDVRQQPRLFFGDYVPKMEDVIDLAEYNDDLFLLHADGQITKCVYSGLAESPTRCDDPYPYSDNRPGRVHGPVIEDVVFSQIYFSSLPERSIYMLDPQNQSIFYFSVLLNLQWQYQPVKSFADGKATAFAISPVRTAFLAINNYVYYAALP